MKREFFKSSLSTEFPTKRELFESFLPFIINFKIEFRIDQKILDSRCFFKELLGKI
jgi:hypothetical protein